GGEAAARTLHGAWLAAAPLVAVSVAAAALLRRAPYVAVGWCWYLGTLVPVIGLVQVGQQAMADRYAYLPLIGVVVIVAWGLRDALRARPALRAPAIAALCALVLTYALVARQQLAVWHDAVTVLTHAVEVVPDSYFSHTNLAAVLMQLGRSNEAEQHYAAAL